MISLTGNPRVLKLVLERTYEVATGRADIVCQLEATREGLLITYLGHQFWTRQTSNGSWQRGEFRALPLTPALADQIKTGAMLEFWGMFCRPRVVSGNGGK